MEEWADLVILNADVVTLNEPPSAEAVAAKDGKIVFVGSSDEARRLIGPRTRVIDAKGAAVIPGLIDCHIHPVMLGFSLMRIDLREARSISEVKRVVAKRATGQEEWVIGRGWDQEKFAEGRYPTRSDLDEVAPNNPVLLTRVCGHVCVINSRALELSGITRGTSDPEGGVIDRDLASGDPTGVLSERAQELVWRAVPQNSFQDYVRAAERALEEALSHGLTTLHWVSATPEEIRVLQYLHRERKLPIRIRLYIHVDYLDHVLALGISRGLGDSLLRIQGVKVLTDGSLGGRTAAMRHDYSDNPGNRGVLLYTHEQLNSIVQKAHKAGLQLAIHAIGDRAVEASLTSLERVLGAGDNAKHRHRIEHASVLGQDLLEKMREMGVLASVQPRFIVSDFWAVKRVGGERARWVYPFKSLLARGLKVCFGSDAPVDPLDPMYQMYSAVERGRTEDIELYERSKDEALTNKEALEAYTVAAAYAAFDEDELGSIRVGKQADLVVISRNPLKTSPSEVRKISVITTIVSGQVVYSKE